MFDYRDLFQWDRFITPSIIKIFYWLAVGISVLYGLSGIISGLALMSLHPLGGLLWVIGSLIGIVIGVLFARIISEFVLIMNGWSSSAGTAISASESIAIPSRFSTTFCRGRFAMQRSETYSNGARKRSRSRSGAG